MEIVAGSRQNVSVFGGVLLKSPWLTIYRGRFAKIRAHWILAEVNLHSITIDRDTKPLVLGLMRHK